MSTTINHVIETQILFKLKFFSHCFLVDCPRYAILYTALLILSLLTNSLTKIRKLVYIHIKFVNFLLEIKNNDAK